MSHLKHPPQLLGWLADSLKGRIVAKSSMTDAVERCAHAASLGELVKKAQDTTVSLVQLLEKLSLASNSTRGSQQSEQQRIHNGLCHAASKLNTIYQAMEAKSTSSSQEDEIEKEDTNSSMSFT